MGRSLKKGPFVNAKLLKAIEELKLYIPARSAVVLRKVKVKK